MYSRVPGQRSYAIVYLKKTIIIVYLQWSIYILKSSRAFNDEYDCFWHFAHFSAKVSKASLSNIKGLRVSMFAVQYGCRFNRCMNGGVCVKEGRYHDYCFCPKGYNGYNCEQQGMAGQISFKQKQTKKIRMNMSLVSNLLFRPIFWKLWISISWRQQTCRCMEVLLRI